MNQRNFQKTRSTRLNLYACTSAARRWCAMWVAAWPAAPAERPVETAMERSAGTVSGAIQAPLRWRRSARGAPPLSASRHVLSRPSNRLSQNRRWTTGSASVADVAPGPAPLRSSPARNPRPGLKRQSLRTSLPARSPSSATAAPGTGTAPASASAPPAPCRSFPGVNWSGRRGLLPEP